MWLGAANETGGMKDPRGGGQGREREAPCCGALLLREVQRKQFMWGHTESRDSSESYRLVAESVISCVPIYIPFSVNAGFL